MSLAHILHCAEDVPEVWLMVLLEEPLPLPVQAALDSPATPEGLAAGMLYTAFSPSLEHMTS